MMSVVEDFAYALKSLETRDDILAQWSHMDARFKTMEIHLLNEEIKAGSAQILARHLHHRLLLRPLSDRTNNNSSSSSNSTIVSCQNRYYVQLSAIQTLHVMVLCSLIGTLIRRSTIPMSAFGLSFFDDVTASLPRVVRFFVFGLVNVRPKITTLSTPRGQENNTDSSNNNNSARLDCDNSGGGSSCRDDDETIATLRNLTLSSCVYAMDQLLTTNCTNEISLTTGTVLIFVDSLLELLRSNFTSRGGSAGIPSDIVVQAACTLSRVVGTLPRCMGHHDTTVWTLVWNSRDVMLSVLTAAASTDGLRANALIAVGHLARCRGSRSDGSHESVSFGAVMVQRSSFMRAIHQCLTTKDVVTHRKQALELIRLLVPYFGSCSENYKSSLLMTNLSLALLAVGKASLKESNLSLKVHMVNVLSDLLAVRLLDCEHFDEGLRTLYLLSTLGNSDEVSVQSATLYLRFANDSAIQRNSVGTLNGIAHFTCSPCLKVRLESLQVLKHISFWKPDSVQLLLTSTDVLDRLSNVLTSIGSDADCYLVMEICQQVLFDRVNHTIFCSHHVVLSALAGLVTAEPILHRRAYGVAVGVVVDLLTHDNLISFLPLAGNLLPWLIRLTNRTTDEDMKLRLSAAIVGFTSVILLEC